MALNTPHIPGIVGDQHARGSEDSEKFRQQHATSSCEPEHHMNPKLIIDPQCKNDIALVIQIAKTYKIAVEIHSGGHHRAAWSTSSENIQLNLKNTFRKVDSASKEDSDLYFYESHGKAYVRTSVSWNLRELNKFLGEHQAFVPYGRGTHASLGGHVQTSRFGQLGRSFGLLGDYVRSLEVVDHHGRYINVTKGLNPELFYAILGGSHEVNEDLFYAILGGSPGNLGVITHFTIEVHRDSDHIFSISHRPHGLKSFYTYDPKTLKRLLDILVEMSEKQDFPRNYDFCVSVLSSDFNLQALVPEKYTEMREHHPELFGVNDIHLHPRVIVVYAQWVPFAATDDLEKANAWFKRIKEGSFYGNVETNPVSVLTTRWLFWDEVDSEFKHPSIKHTHQTNSTTLSKKIGASKKTWASWMSERIDELVKPHGNKIWVSALFQYFGGHKSKFVTEADHGTSYSWRDCTVACTLDCFYGSEVAKKTVKKWVDENEKVMIREAVFSKDDRRVLWAPFEGDEDLDANWEHYYEEWAKYHKLGTARTAADPNGTFTPDAFCVKRQNDA